MKKFFILAVAALAAFSCTEKKAGYTVTVNVGDDDFTSFILTNREKENPVADTVAVVEKKAVFTGNVDGFDVRYIMGVKEGVEPEYLGRLFLENANYTVSFTADGDHFHSNIESDGPIQMQFDSLNNVIKAVYEKNNMHELEKLYEAGDQKVKDSIMNIVKGVGDEIEVITNDFYAKNPLCPLALENAASDIRYVGLDSARKLVEKFAAVPAFATNRLFKNMQKELEKKEALAPGNQAPDFTLNDPEGNPVKFSEVYPKNKVTMIDFWASWCGPCRKFNPTLTQIYAKYNKKGFGILGVSLDREQEKWVEAIKADKLVWQHVSDLKFWDSEAGRLYNISSIPQSYFVDSEGKILLASPSEDQIESFLAEYLK